MFSLNTAKVFDGPWAEVVRLTGRRFARPSAGFGLDVPAPAVEEDKGGRDVLADRTGIMLGGGITARFGRGLTSFGTSEPPIASWDDTTATGFIASLVTGFDSDVVASGFARGVLKLNGMGTVGTMRPTPGVVALSSADGR